jgi:hypothetical protein
MRFTCGFNINWMLKNFSGNIKKQWITDNYSLLKNKKISNNTTLFLSILF